MTNEYEMNDSGHQRKYDQEVAQYWQSAKE